MTSSTAAGTERPFRFGVVAPLTTAGMAGPDKAHRRRAPVVAELTGHRAGLVTADESRRRRRRSGPME